MAEGVELCPVCGDRVSGYHYGLLTCESCKGFFKRTVQNNKQYMCAEYQDCRMDKSRRKRCPFCRFQKCLRVGMMLEAVRADRLRGGRNKFGPMYKRERALRQQRQALMGTQSSPPLAPSVQHTDLLHGPLFHTSYQPALSPASPQLQSFSEWDLRAQHRANMCPGSAATGLCSDQTHRGPFSPRAPRTPALVVELLRCEPDERQLQTKVSAALLQEQQGSPGPFSLLCRMADHTLTCIVEWARTSLFFRQLKVSDQMKLLQSCWSDLLLLDVLSRQVLYGREDSLLLVTGQQIELSAVWCHAGPTLSSLVHRGQELLGKLHSIKVDRPELACIKFLVLFNADVEQLEEPGFIRSVWEQVEAALLEYTVCSRRCAQLLLCVAELRAVSILAEGYLRHRHRSGDAPCNNLLIEMLNAEGTWE